MATRRELVEIAACCVSTMVYYHNSERSKKAEAELAHEAGEIAREVEKIGLTRAEIDRSLVRPLEDELQERYGSEIGRQLVGQFLTAFGDSREAHP